MIGKGYVSSILNNGRKVTVVPAFSDEVVTHELVVPFFLWECLKVKMEIVYCCFPDNTGVVLARTDGEWNHKIWKGESYAVEVMTGDALSRQGDVILDLGDVNVLAGDVHIPAGDLQTSAVASHNAHTHTCPDGTTSGPS